MLCDTNGYILDFIIYTGHDTNYKEKFSHLPVTDRMVMTLDDDYLELGYCIAMHNYYCSPKLFLKLGKRKTDALGTVRSNRKSLPLNFRNAKLKKGERVVRYYKKLMALK